MSQERRTHRRARFPGMRVTYEDAAGRRVETEALDVSGGGLFVLTEEVIAVGKRLSVDITLPGGSSKWSVLARVVWVRERAGDAGPAGMGMKLIDAEENMIAAIRKLVASREATDPGTGGSKTPSRERTVMGVGKSEETGVAATPIVTAAPARERTQLGIGISSPVAPEVKLAPAPSVSVAREMSIPIELVAKKKAETEELPTRRVEVPRIERELSWGEPQPEPKPKAVEPPIERELSWRMPEPEPKPEPKPQVVEAPPSEASLAAAGVPRRRGRAWIGILLLLAIGGVGYAFRSRIPFAAFSKFLHQPPPPTAAATQEPPPVAASVAPSVMSAVPPPSAAPSAAPSGSVATRPSATPSAAASPAPSASASGSAKPHKPPAHAASASAAPRHSGAPSSDDPY